MSPGRLINAFHAVGKIVCVVQIDIGLECVGLLMIYLSICCRNKFKCVLGELGSHPSVSPPNHPWNRMGWALGRLFALTTQCKSCLANAVRHFWQKSDDSSKFDQAGLGAEVLYYLRLYWSYAFDQWMLAMWPGLE